uniref:GON-4-like protein n=5 Tax=Lygus hesperus TaxID=30085 RepID=A0A146KZI7_LYGHE
MESVPNDGKLCSSEGEVAGLPRGAFRSPVKPVSSKKSSPISAPFSSSSRGSIILSELEDELERQLEEKANRNELSAKNVKSLLRAVLIHEDVRKYVEFSLKRTDEQPEYQWKLTRAKAKELIDKLPNIAPLLCLPIPQKRSDIDALINEELPEDSSDEEYQPLDETVDDDEDSVCHHVEDESSIMSPPPSVMCQETNSPITSLENIGQRTRSKFSLSQTPLETIEQAFIPPDITEDMYNTECDNQDWLNFLKDLVQPLDNTADNVETNDDENDPEYNIMVDEELEDLDNEELRIDRAVKISRKEVEDLMSELFEYTQMHEDGFNSDDESCVVEPVEVVDDLIITQPISLSVPEALVGPPQNANPVVTDPTVCSVSTIIKPVFDNEILTHEQYLLLQQQLMQHTQLLLQCYLLSCGNPFVDVITHSAFKSNLMELKSLRDASPCSSSSIFSFPTLQSSLDLMSEYDTFVQSNKVALNRWNQLMASKPSYKKTVHEGSPGIHPHLMSLCLKSDAFQYPLLLPKMGFKSCPFPQRNRFSEAEDRLVAFGLEDCEHNLGCNLISNRDLLEASDLIRRSLIPVKTAESICQHILKRRNSKFPNTIQDYFLFRKAPGIEHFVVPIDFSQGLLPLFQLDVQLIDVRWHRILYLERERQMLLEENVKKEEVSSTTPELTEPVPVTTN